MFRGEAWYEYLTEAMQDLVGEAFYLLEKHEMEAFGFHDYSFVVFPAAKAYEGFVKKYIVDLGILPLAKVNSRLFRVGKSLNPALPPKFRNKTWIYDDLKSFCQELDDKGENTAELMWEAWQQGRNKLFHFFPGHEEFISLTVARHKLELIVEAMKMAVECRRRLS
jgi:hypothetical protein